MDTQRHRKQGKTSRWIHWVWLWAIRPIQPREVQNSCFSRRHRSVSLLHNYSADLRIFKLDSIHSHTTSSYRSGWSAEDFVDKIIQFRQFIKEKDISARSLLQLIGERNLQTVFPNVNIALRLFMTLPVTKRSFSKLGLVKNILRSTMGHKVLSHLPLMSIEHDVLRKLDFTSIVKDFSARVKKENILKVRICTYLLFCGCRTISRQPQLSVHRRKQGRGGADASPCRLIFLVTF